jgi:chemotaxis-related protein WspD
MTGPDTQHDCWNRIGVRGDRSCPELERFVHCRNCPVQSAAAQTLLDRQQSTADLLECTLHFAKRKPADERGTKSVVIFRIGPEWLALPTPIVDEIADIRPIHSIPHRRDGAILGVVNVRGELVVCVSLNVALKISGEPEAAQNGAHATHQRLLVLRCDDVRAVCPANEVHGVHRVAASDLIEVPSTVGKAAGTHARAVFTWKGHSVGLLEDDALFQTLRRSLS